MCKLLQVHAFSLLFDVVKERKNEGGGECTKAVERRRPAEGRICHPHYKYSNKKGAQLKAQILLVGGNNLCFYCIEGQNKAKCVLFC